MDFNVNSPVLFVVAGIAVAVVLAQSVCFLIKLFSRSRRRLPSSSASSRSREISAYRCPGCG